MERVKTFEDACKVLGEEHFYVQEYKNVANINFDFTQDIIAYFKLRIICAALNEGWKPTFDENEQRYYPWFYIYTKEEYKELNEYEKKEYYDLLWSNNNMNAVDDLVFVYMFSSGSNSNAYYGVRLAFKTRELAESCGKQFINIWANFLFS